MKKQMLVIGGFSLMLLLSACSSSELSNALEKNEMDDTSKRTRFEVINIGDQYSVDVPNFMTSTKSLENDALLQYTNRFKEKHVVVIDESKEDFKEICQNIGEYDDSKSLIENYAESQIRFISEVVGVIDESAIDYMEINGMAGAKKLMDANVAGVPEPISYYFGFVEGEESLYMIKAWTLKRRKDQFASEATRMIHSLKEL